MVETGCTVNGESQGHVPPELSETPFPPPPRGTPSGGVTRRRRYRRLRQLGGPAWRLRPVVGHDASSFLQREQFDTT